MGKHHLRLAHALPSRVRRPRVPAGIRTRRLADQGGLRVYLVDGERIRDLIDTDFTMGGNDGRYRYVPRGEVWVEQTLSSRDRATTVLHEVEERRRMVEGGEDYGRAHDGALEVERAWRKVNG